MVRTLIIENEPGAANNLLTLLERNFADISVMAICQTVKESLEAIKTYIPDLVFLDVELNPPETSFDILNRLADINFKIIFTTSFDQYAIKAIKFSALDYLIKPIDEEELKISVRKFIKERIVTSPHQREALLSYHQIGPDSARIPIPDQNGLIMVHVKDILFFEGADNQVIIHFIKGDPKKITKTLKDCKDAVEKFGFFLIHKSYLVNAHHILEYIKGDGGFVRLQGGKKLSVSKTYREDLIASLGKI